MLQAEAFLKVDALEKVYSTADGNITALKDITLTIGSPEFVSVLGPSGCGKSTLLRCIAGLERPTRRTISLHGVPVRDPPDDMGIVFQRDVLLDWLTVLRNVLLPSRFRGCLARSGRQGARVSLDAHRAQGLRAAAFRGNSRAACASVSRSAARCCSIRRCC